jgi:hypothetical protein
MSDQLLASRFELPLRRDGDAVAIQDLIFEIRLLAQQGDAFIDVVRGFSFWLGVSCVGFVAVSSGSSVSVS